MTTLQPRRTCSSPAFLAALLMAAFLAHGQEPAKAAVKRVGYISAGPPEGRGHLEAPIMDGLRVLGYTPGRNVVLEVRYANGDMSQVKKIAEEFEALKLDAVVTTCTPTTMAMNAATTRIPIVMAMVSDPVGQGLVDSLAMPGRNVTGTSSQFEDVIDKMVELFATLLPRQASIGVLANARNPVHPRLWEALQKAGGRLGLRMQRYAATGTPAVLPAMEEIARGGHAGVFLLPDDPLFFNYRKQIVAKANALRLPAFYYAKEFVQAGGLVSYGQDMAAGYQRAAFYVDRIFKGARPAQLAVEQPSTFELWINAAAARNLGIALPPSLLVKADGVVE